MDVLFAGVPVREFARSRDWYVRLFGRGPDVVAHELEVMWRVTDGGWLYVVQDPDRAGGSLVAIAVADLQAALEDLATRDLHAGPIEPQGEGAHKANLTDPDGNVVGLIQVAA
jgi:predicted enzyme related to lactoylglutathione lyase